MPKLNELVYVLGGGEGKRLHPLTKGRAKPAVPFAGSYRVIDWVLSNIYNSQAGSRKVLILTQYQSESLHSHIRDGWYPRVGSGQNNSFRILPASQGEQNGWYRGTANAIFQNKGYIENENPSIVNIFGGDHIYIMDIRDMNQFHNDNNADLTISAIPVKIENAAKTFGVLVVDKHGKLVRFEEKPEQPTPIPGNEKYCLASMGNYVFKSTALLEELVLDGKKEYNNDNLVVKENPDTFTKNDFGFDIIPSMLRQGKNIFVYDFSGNPIDGEARRSEPFWRDVGSLVEFYNTSMEVGLPRDIPNAYHPNWPILTYNPISTPAKVRKAQVNNSLLTNGTNVNSGKINGSILSYNTTIDGADISDTILMGDNVIGKGVILKRTIVEKGVIIPKGTLVGIDLEYDKNRGFTVDLHHKITVIPKGYIFDK